MNKSTSTSATPAQAPGPAVDNRDHARDHARNNASFRNPQQRDVRARQRCSDDHLITFGAVVMTALLMSVAGFFQIPPCPDHARDSSQSLVVYQPESARDSVPINTSVVNTSCVEQCIDALQPPFLHNAGCGGFPREITANDIDYCRVQCTA